MKKTANWVKNIRRKFTPISLAALIVVSAFTFAFTPLVTDTARAASPDDILNRARAWSVLNAVIDKANFAPPNVTNEQIDSCRFLQGPGDIYVGSHVTGDNDDQSWDAIQNNSSFLNSGLSSVGIQNGCRGLLTALGWTITTTGMDKPANFNSDSVRQKLQGIVAPDAFFGGKLGNEGPGEALTYAILIYHLKNVCGWQFRNPYVANDGSNTIESARNKEAQNNGATGNDEGQHYHTWTYENGGAGDNTYYKEGGSTGGVNVGSKVGAPGITGNNDAEIDCGASTATTFGAILQNNPSLARSYDALVGNDGTTDAGAGAGNGDGAADAGKKSTCAIQAIGWLLCPVLNVAAKIVDGAYNIVEGLLKVQPLNVSGAGSEGVYQAWQVMRNFANVAFIIAFLFIVFSQVTSIGITNYGIKKMLPRLVVAAILVNASFWICAIAVDISNILGGSLNGLFHGIADSIALKDQAFSGTGNGWEVITGKILAGTAGAAAGAALIYVTLSALIPALVACLIVIVAIFVLLVIRQAFIILLIVVSPLAFVAYLLPNTESLFRRWRELLQILLLMYPIIALIFGMSALASKVLMAGAQ